MTLSEKFALHNPSRPAIIQSWDSTIISYGELLARIDKFSYCLDRLTARPFMFLYPSNSVDAITIYLCCLKINLPVCLLEPTPKNLKALITAYHPPLLCLPAELSGPKGYMQSDFFPNASYNLYLAQDNQAWNILPHTNLALLLQTSGSTGNPKLIRLNQINLYENARSICEYLELSPEERSIQGLPMQYSYGLSLINSHFLVGGTVVLTSHSFMMPEFWQDFDTHKCSSFAGVPYMYETLHRLDFDPAEHPTLHIMTQAGGKLRPDLIQWFYKRISKANCRFFVMYGQTEATARISYVPPNRLDTKIDSIGIPIPGGRLELQRIEEKDDLHELVYHGPNVMMGYAESAESLSGGDELDGVLHTGDLARMDEDGYFYLVGRLKRFAKLYGRRINLLDVESIVEKNYPARAAVFDTGENHLSVYIELFEQEQTFDVSAIALHISKCLDLPPSTITVRMLDTLPMTASGKKNYAALNI